MFSKTGTMKSTTGSCPADRLRQALADCDAVIVGAGAGLSAAAGFTYDGERFERNFADFEQKYGFHDMYTGGFYPFPTEEERWAYWSRYIWLNRYTPAPKPVYDDLLKLVRDKDYFVITTNVDHQFQAAGFDKKRLFYTQGDYGLFQCSEPCCQETFDNRETVRQMVERQRDMRVPSDLAPRCPHCGRPMAMNLRCDGRFAEDEGWHRAAERYESFLRTRQGQKLLFLELGVGYNTPVIIKYSFWRMTAANPRAVYACLNLGQAAAPREIQKQSICIDGDIGAVLASLGENTSQSASVEFVRFRRTNSARGRLQAFCQKRALPFFDSLKRPEPSLSAPSAFLPYFPVSGRGNRVQGQAAGGWWVNTISRPVSGWVKPRRQAHRARASPSPAPPYFRSPTRGKPRPANCTRIWWVRPVCRVTRTRDSPSRTASVS